MILILLLYALLASTFTIGKAVLAYILPVFFIGIRMTLAGVLILAYHRIIKKRSLIIYKQDYWLFAQIILFHIYLAYVLEFWALQCMDSAKAALLYNLSPFITALLAYWTLNERMSFRKWLGLSIGFLGFGPILVVTAYNEWVCGGTSAFISWSEIALLCSIISSAYGWTIVKRLMGSHQTCAQAGEIVCVYSGDQDKTCMDNLSASNNLDNAKNVGKCGYSPIFINGIGMLCGGMFALLTSYAVYGVRGYEITPVMVNQTHGFDLATWFITISHGAISSYWATLFAIVSYMLWLIMCANILFYNLYGKLLQRYSATFLSFAGFTCPLWAALFGYFLLDEQIGWAFFTTLGCVITGLYLFYYDETSWQ